MPYISERVTAQTRAEQMPDEFYAKGDKLFCIWCERNFTSLRLDNLREHLYSKLHEENRLKHGKPVTYNRGSAYAMHRKETKKKALEKRRAQQMKVTAKKATSQTESSDSDVSEDSSSESSESDSNEELSQLFEDTDSEDETESFQGFDDDSEETTDSGYSKPKISRGQKRAAPSDDSISSPSQRSHVPPKKRKRNSYGDSSPSIPIHTMPLKKQISHNAKSSSKRGKLKIKFHRRPQRPSDSFRVESSETDDTQYQAKRHVTSYTGTGDGLKMKFILDKDSSSGSLDLKEKKKPRKERSSSKHSTSTEDTSFGLEAVEVAPPSPDQEEVEEHYDQVEDTFEGVDELIGDTIAIDENVEVVEEEIVGVDEGEVVSWDAVVAEEQVIEEEIVEEEEVPTSPVPPAPEEEELSSEQSLAIKANYAREMAKAVNSAQFKKKALDSKKPDPKAVAKEKQKRKISSYNLWSSKMRRKVANQFPGLQFGEVSKKLGDLWKKIPDKEKQLWKHRSSKMANLMEEEEKQSQTTKRSKGSKMIETGPKKKTVSPKRTPQSPPLAAFPPHKTPELTMQRELQRLPVPALETIDAASHLRLLSQSLSEMGSQVRVSGYGRDEVLPLMLDSLLCCFTPLMSLVNQVPQLQGAVPDHVLSECYSNVAHVMPGF